ncbi:MAG: hypothetical protein Q4C96_02385 [Planctomycetia bacterium]|nr:hypothetical protein [Planctomycetia bacterium]
MQFEIPCPNGHNVRFGLKFAGAVCQCPKCSAKIPIPPLADLRESLGDEIDEETEAAFQEAEKFIAERKARKKQKLLSKKTATENTQKNSQNSDAKTLSGSPASDLSISEDDDTQDEEVIEFFCPNNHSLSAPLSKAGTPETCPVCSARFIVPGLDDEDDFSAQAGAPVQVAVPPVVSNPKPQISISSPQSNAPDAFFIPGLSAETTTNNDSLVLSLSGFSQNAKRDTTQNTQDIFQNTKQDTPDPMFHMFKIFWERTTDEGTIELHTADGKVFPVQGFFENETTQDIGVFKIKNSSDQKVTVAIRWQHINWIQEKKS